jgi:predicted dehydrogenase
VARRLIDVALVGAGPMAAEHARVLHEVEGFRLVSCVSRTREHAEEFARAAGIASARSLDEVLARPEADALWVCVSADAMASAATACAGCGLPMFLEKPVGLDPAETGRALDAVRVPHMVGLNRRFYEIVRHGHDLVRESGGLRAIEVHMPEDLGRVPARHAPRALRQWQFANSVHLIDLFRYFAGEPASVTASNVVRSVRDRSYNGLVRFETGARGIFHSQWYAPGGWRVALYADDLSIVYQPIERAQVLRRGRGAEPLMPAGPDARYKAGLHGQASAFVRLVRDGRLPPGAADLADYARSVALVQRLTAVEGANLD